MSNATTRVYTLTAQETLDCSYGCGMDGRNRGLDIVLQKVKRAAAKTDATHVYIADADGNHVETIRV